MTIRENTNRVFPELTPREEELFKEQCRELCKQDLHYLAKTVLGYNKVTDHYHKQMARDIDTPKYKFKLLLHPRGHFKSTLGTESRAIQKLLRNPNERILITNAKLDNSRKFLRAITHHWRANTRFRWIWRDWWIRTYASDYDRAEYGDKLDWIIRDTIDELILLRPYQGREASITTGAVDSSLVSQHFSTIIADDLVNRDYVRTSEMVEKSVLYFKDLLDLLDPDGELELIGTRWSHHDLYSWIIAEFGGKASFRVPEGYVSEEILQKAAATPEEEKDWMVSIQPCYKDRNQTEPVFPEEFSPKVLEDLLRAKGPYEFGAQYLLNPTPREHQQFREEWFHYFDIMPDTSQMSVCITVDPAKSLQDQADNTAIAVFGYDKKNYMYLLDGRDEKLSIDELPEALWELVVKWRARCQLFLPVGFEAVGFQETFIYTLERMMLERNCFFSITPIRRRSQSKEERILRLVPRVKNGFYLPRSLKIVSYRGDHEYDLVQRLKFQLLNFPFAGKDDLADATADQLEIVAPHGAPIEKSPVAQPEKKVGFIHPSILEDRRRLKRQHRVSDAVR